MALKLFELVGTDEARPFSPFCWRTRMALAHKGLSAESIPWCFTEKAAIAPHNSEKVPVLIDGESSVADSWAIANYLEDRYPDRRSLFGGAGRHVVKTDTLTFDLSAGLGYTEDRYFNAADVNGEFRTRYGRAEVLLAEESTHKWTPTTSFHQKLVCTSLKHKERRKLFQG